MKKTENTVKIDFQKGIRGAEHLENIADKIEKRLAVQMSECMKDVATNWRGDSAQAYCYKGKIVAENLTDGAKALRDLAFSMLEILRKYREVK